AMFINEYYSLKIKTRQVNFHSIWMSNSDLNKFLNKNIGLSSIFWIAKDFDNGDNSLTANPNSKRLKIIRNYLEHRFTNITLNFFDGSVDNNESRLYLTEFELKECTLDLLNLVREVIFSLKNAIQISENEKQSTLSSEVALIPINYEEVDLEDKL
ncbi:TPA: LA2681 family HEPN domain-containing protein, partial [Streptococcus agalactiae]